MGTIYDKGVNKNKKAMQESIEIGVITNRDEFIDKINQVRKLLDEIENFTHTFKLDERFNSQKESQSEHSHT